MHTILCSCRHLYDSKLELCLQRLKTSFYRRAYIDDTRKKRSDLSRHFCIVIRLCVWVTRLMTPYITRWKSVCFFFQSFQPYTHTHNDMYITRIQKNGVRRGFSGRKHLCAYYIYYIYHEGVRNKHIICCRGTSIRFKHTRHEAALAIL